MLQRATALGGRRAEDTVAQQIELGPAVHLPLEQLEPIHLAFGLSLIPRELKRRADRCVVAADALGKGGEFPHTTRPSPLKPGVELVASLLIEEREEGLHRLPGGGDDRRATEQIADISCLERRECFGRLQEEPRDLPWGGA